MLVAHRGKKKAFALTVRQADGRQIPLTNGDKEGLPRAPFSGGREAVHLNSGIVEQGCPLRGREVLCQTFKGVAQDVV